MARSGSYHQVLEEKVHVLLVDHETDSLHRLKALLELHSYKATIVRSALEVLQVLAKGKEKVDLLLADVDIPDLHGFSLVQDAVKYGVPTILMTGRGDVATKKKALENGACFAFGKPLEEKEIESLWMYVLKERISKTKPLGCGKSSRSESRGSFVEIGGSEKKQRRVRMTWTKELEAKFEVAVKELGDKKCNAENIHRLMNVPDLELHHVANHLRTCRRGTKKPTTVPSIRSSSTDIQPSDARETTETKNIHTIQGSAGTEEKNMISVSSTTTNLPILVPDKSKDGANDMQHSSLLLSPARRQVASNHQKCRYGVWRSVVKSPVVPSLVNASSSSSLQVDNRSFKYGQKELSQDIPQSGHYQGMMVENVVQGNQNVTQGTSTTMVVQNLTPLLKQASATTTVIGANDQRPVSSNQVSIEDCFLDIFDDGLAYLLDTNHAVNLEDIFSDQHFGSPK